MIPGFGVDNPISFIVKEVLAQVRQESQFVKLEVIALEADGKVRLKDEYGQDAGPWEQTNPAYAAVAGEKIWAVRQGGGYLVLSK